MELLTKRSFLRGLFAAPAIVAASSLMQIRGVSLIRTKELSTAEIISLLERRIDAANAEMQNWMSQKLYGDVHGFKVGAAGPEGVIGNSPYVRFQGYELLNVIENIKRAGSAELELNRKIV